MSSAVSYEYLQTRIPAESEMGFTTEGGLYITLVNKTGAASIKGTMVSCSNSYNNSCMVTQTSGIGSNKSIGVIYDNGIPDGSKVRVVVSGKAYVLLEDEEYSTHGQWCGSSLYQAGRVLVADEPSSTSEHFREIGHCLESVSAGTNKLCLVVLHFN